MEGQRDNKHVHVQGNENFPSRQVPPHMPANAKLPTIDELRSWNRMVATNEDWRQIWVLDDGVGPVNDHPGVEQPLMPTISDKHPHVKNRPLSSSTCGRSLGGNQNW